MFRVHSAWICSKLTRIPAAAGVLARGSPVVECDLFGFHTCPFSYLQLSLLRLLNSNVPILLLSNYPHHPPPLPQTQTCPYFYYPHQPLHFPYFHPAIPLPLPQTPTCPHSTLLICLHPQCVNSQAVTFSLLATQVLFLEVTTEK